MTMPESQEQQPSSLLIDMIVFAFQEGFKAIEERGLLSPFFIAKLHGKKDWSRINGDLPDISDPKAKESPGILAFTTALVHVYNATIVENGEIGWAVVVEAAERGQPRGYLCSQCYRGGNRDEPLQKVGGFESDLYFPQQRNTSALNEDFDRRLNWPCFAGWTTAQAAIAKSLSAKA
jgi:hypothetical protein